MSGQRIRRAGLYVALNAGLLWAAWAGVHGNEMAGNVLKFGLWFALAVNALVLFGAGFLEDEVFAKEPVSSIPPRIGFAVDLVLAILLAAFGWFGYATIALSQGLLQYAVATYAAKRRREACDTGGAS